MGQRRRPSKTAGNSDDEDEDDEKEATLSKAENQSFAANDDGDDE